MTKMMYFALLQLLLTVYRQDASFYTSGQLAALKQLGLLFKARYDNLVLDDIDNISDFTGG